MQNNGKALVLQSANSDSSRDGQFDNSVGFIGVSSPTYGTLTVGRVTSLTLDGVIAYDPMGGSYAFSALGYSGSYAGFGDTETNRANTGVKYRVNFMNFRGGGLVQWGGYDQGNGTTGLYQGDVGADFDLFGGTPFAGTLSVDGIGSYAQNAVNLSNFTGTCATLTKGPLKGQTGCSDGIPMFYGADDLKATLSNNTGAMLLARYRWGPVTVSGGWLWWQQANPSDTYLNGFETVGGYSVPATIPAINKTIAKLFPTQWVTSNAYNDIRVVNVPFIGVKYAVTPQFDVVGAFYYEIQNNYNSSTTPCAAVPTTLVQTKREQFHRYPRQQHRLRRHARRNFLHGRLSAGQARRPLRRRDDLERLCRPRERLPAGPKHRPDGRLAHQVLTAASPPSCSRAAWRGPRLTLLRRAREAPSPVVDAAPPDAIVGIPAQAVGLVNVVRVVLIGVRASEHPGQLARGELQCGPQR